MKWFELDGFIKQNTCSLERVFFEMLSTSFIQSTIQIEQLNGSRTGWIGSKNELPNTVELAVMSYLQERGFSCSREYEPLLRAILVSLIIPDFDKSNFLHREILTDICHGTFFVGGTEEVSQIRKQRSPSFGFSDRLTGPETRAEIHREWFNLALNRVNSSSRVPIAGVVPIVITGRLAKLDLAAEQKTRMRREIFGSDIKGARASAIVSELFKALDAVAFLRFRADWFRKSLQSNRRGMPDLLVWSERDHVFLEVKTKNDRLSSEQKDRIAKLNRCGLNSRVLNVLSN